MKHMKKSMFITTVMMVVLLIVAVSTATFAWYTSSNTVNTAITNVNSAESTGANISIGWADTTPVGVSQLTFASQDTDFYPMVPTNNEGASFVFNNTTPFYTANISYGTLSNHSSATPYVGTKPNPSGGATTFFVVNYARKATNITFSANVTGENATRLRVAVFNADTGALVYTNKDIYYGTIMNAVDAVFTLVEEAPAGWADNYASYSTSTGTFTAVAPVAPTWQANTYWTSGGVLTTEIPVDWEGQYMTYSTSPSLMVPVVGVAPAFSSLSTVYSYVAALPVRMVAPGTQVFSAVNVATQIALSDGVTGVPQGFIVKAWFDGPTQVDAYGGTDANFTLTASAANVA